MKDWGGSGAVDPNPIGDESGGAAPAPARDSRPTGAPAGDQMQRPRRVPSGPSESRRSFRRRVDRALDDASLQTALTEAMVGLRERRNRAFESYPFEAGREDLKRRRRANLERLPELMARFQERLEAAGGVFHLAHDEKDAQEIIGRICSGAGAGVVTKSKSMATEEIHLNHHLESLGMEVVETDLGEYMVQRLGQRPSHMIAPAVHLTLQDWATELGTAPDRDQIMDQVRTSLREKFVEASVGISGANAAIAETGTVMIVTNEGNADLTVTLPRVHIALFGIDKLVDSLDDAVAILRMLPRSGTGQIMTSYVNWITGPSRSSDIGFVPLTGAHGPREMHCVVLDNGRSQMLNSPLFAPALSCIRCGACSNACPAFMAVGGHQFGHIYTGPIGLVVSPFHHGLASIELAQSLCTQCNACEEICPVGIPLPRQILEHRRESTKSWPKRGLLELWSHPAVADAALQAAAPLSGLMPVGPAPLARPRYASRERIPSDGDPLTIFTSCLADRFAPQSATALERIAVAAGFKVDVPARQWCCGLVCANAGDFDKASKLARDLARTLAQSTGPIVTPSASCFGALTQDSQEWRVAGTDLASVRDRLHDSTRWLLALLRARPELLVADAPKTKVAYHDSCQSLRQLGLAQEPRRILELAGYEVVELADIANCCGFGGTFSFDWPRVADRMAHWKLDAAVATGALTLASDNPGCLLHIEAAARRAGVPMQVRHVSELVAERLRGAAAAGA
ncbi:MAG TPA: LUD domain-containing protein [Candidatus Nitrosotalea sp.]|nr:LUD domain-containing protein [Candidatus Nitrosotalea sp.]